MVGAGPWDAVTEGHPIGYSGSKSTYRRGVCVDNFAEEILAGDYVGRPGCVLDSGAGRFEGSSLARDSYRPHDVAPPRREDLLAKYVKRAGGDAIPTEGVSTFATMNQLAYAAPAPGAPPPPRAAELVWTGTKFADRKVPLAAPGAYSLVQERRKQWEEEQARDPYLTVEKEQLEAVAQSPARGSAKPPQCRPQAEGGQEAQVGRKAVGPCASLFDKDYLRIGLRKGGPASR